MTREIKFRAWFTAGTDTGDGEIEKGEMCYDLAFEEYAPINDLLKGVEHLMQYTGLKDKNGKDIYEGDKLGGLYGDLHVIWCEHCRGWALYCEQDKECYDCNGEVHWKDLDLKELEVIGNVFEHP